MQNSMMSMMYSDTALQRVRITLSYQFGDCFSRSSYWSLLLAWVACWLGLRRRGTSEGGPPHRVHGLRPAYLSPVQTHRRLRRTRKRLRQPGRVGRQPPRRHHQSGTDCRQNYFVKEGELVCLEFCPFAIAKEMFPSECFVFVDAVQSS